MKIIGSVFAAIVFISIGFGLVSLGGVGSKKKWDPEEVYAVWVEGVEVSPNAPDGSAWNKDGKAPNLTAKLFWRNTLILETPEASHTLIARWDRTALKIKNLLKTELAPNAMENVARIHAGPDELIAVEVEDQGLLNCRWMGALSIPCGKLRPGLNILNPADSRCIIQSLSLRVAPSSTLENNCRLPEDKTVIVEGIVIMPPPPSPGIYGFENSAVSKKIQEGIKGGVKAVSELLQNTDAKP